MRTPKLRFMFLRTALFPVLLTGSHFAASAQTPAGWQSVSPGFSAEVLLSHSNVMWAAGSAETIAVSIDGGQHWQKKHEDPNGGLLLTFAFVNEKFGYAAGTGTRLLMTDDGGETWTARMPVPETVFQAAFGDPQHGVIRARSALLATTDGGKSWKPVIPVNDPAWSQKLPETVALTALDSMHLLIRVAGDGGEYLSTTDGGATWKATVLPSGAGSNGAFVVQGKYWSVGSEVVGKDKPGGGYSTPMAVRSSDGDQWEHLLVYHDVCHWTGCGGCTPQGCFAGRSSFVPFSRILQDAPGNGAGSGSGLSTVQPESLARFPAHLLSDQWARSGNRLCLLTNGVIDCTTLSLVATLDTRDDLAEWENRSYPLLHLIKANPLANGSIEPVLKAGVHCIRCDLERLYISKEGGSGPVAIQISFAIEKNGRVSSVALSGNVPSEVADRLRHRAASWLFEPYLVGGVPTATTVGLRGSVFILNPDKPPTSASRGRAPS
jgi:hypothetical protein